MPRSFALQPHEKRTERPDIARVGGVADVEIPREARTGLDDHGHAADDDEVDARVAEGGDETRGAEVTPARHATVHLLV